MLNIGIAEMVFIFLIIFILFGAKALPEIAKGLGQAIRTFKKETRELTSEFDEAAHLAKVDESLSYPKKHTEVNTDNDFKNDTEKRKWRPDSSAPESKG